MSRKFCIVVCKNIGPESRADVDELFKILERGDVVDHQMRGPGCSAGTGRGRADLSLTRPPEATVTPNSNGGDGGATSSRADVQQVSKTGKSNLNSRRIHGMVSSPSVLLERN